MLLLWGVVSGEGKGRMAEEGGGSRFLNNKAKRDEFLKIFDIFLKHILKIDLQIRIRIRIRIRK